MRAKHLRKALKGISEYAKILEINLKESYFVWSHGFLNFRCYVNIKDKNIAKLAEKYRSEQAEIRDTVLGRTRNQGHYVDNSGCFKTDDTWAKTNEGSLVDVQYYINENKNLLAEIDSLRELLQEKTAEADALKNKLNRANHEKNNQKT